MPENLRVTVVWADTKEVCVRDVQLPAGSSIEDAIRASGMLAAFPEIDLARNAVGVYNRLCDLSDSVAEGDRVEIYRPLLADPKEARRRRAGKQHRD